MTKIKDAVGNNALNAKIECAYIQVLLNVKLAKTQGFTKIAEDGLCGPTTIKAIRTFQQTQAKLYHVDGRVDPGKHTFNTLISGLSATELTAYWNKAVLTQNKGLIIDEQAKRAQATNQPLKKKLIPKPDATIPSDIAGFSFPFSRLPTRCYQNNSGCAFDSNRGERKHAGCDMHMTPGEPVYAMADGTVRFDPGYFYGGTYALEITHGNYVFRYGELFPSAATPESKAKDLLPKIRAGYRVTKGELIGYVGVVYDPKKNKPIGSMLHFELYDRPDIMTSLTDRSSGVYKRRKDLVNPTRLLDAARNNLSSAKAEKLPTDLINILAAQAIVTAENKGF